MPNAKYVGWVACAKIDAVTGNTPSSEAARACGDNLFVLRMEQHKTFPHWLFEKPRSQRG